MHYRALAIYPPLHAMMIVRLPNAMLHMLPKIRLGDRQDTRGTAFVVYEDIYDAKAAVDHLSGFNVCGRYLIVLYYQASHIAFAVGISL